MTHPRMALFRLKPEKEAHASLPAPSCRAYRRTLLRATIFLTVLPTLGFTVASAEGAPLLASAPAPAAISERPFADEAPDGTAGGAESEGDGDGDESGAGAADGSPLRALACLEGEGGNDSDGARRGVQRRDFLKRLRAELSIVGGHYAADALSSTYAYGAAVAAFVSEDFGIEAMLLRNPVQFRLEQPFNAFYREQHFQAGSAWNWLGAMLWSPIHAKLRFSERHITHADLLLIAGAGQTVSETAQGLTYQVGAGLKLYLARYFSIRFDVRDLLVPQEVLGRGRSTHNVVTLLGLAGWLPG